jgi:hypothetical protein
MLIKNQVSHESLEVFETLQIGPCFALRPLEKRVARNVVPGGGPVGNSGEPSPEMAWEGAGEDHMLEGGRFVAGIWGATPTASWAVETGGGRRRNCVHGEVVGLAGQHAAVQAWVGARGVAGGVGLRWRREERGALLRRHSWRAAAAHARGKRSGGVCACEGRP